VRKYIPFNSRLDISECKEHLVALRDDVNSMIGLLDNLNRVKYLSRKNLREFMRILLFVRISGNHAMSQIANGLEEKYLPKEKKKKRKV
jgi:hypothetical protein